jgi:hypothetical protein
MPLKIKLNKVFDKTFFYLILDGNPLIKSDSEVKIQFSWKYKQLEVP